MRLNSGSTVSFSLPFLAWLGGAFWVAEQPGYGFWDGLVWLWYLGRFIACHFTALS
jgi:hypothetical protein